MTILFMIVSLASLAQSAGKDGPTPPPPSPEGRMPPSLPGLVVPIDENIKVLLFLGLMLGVIYFFRNRFSKA